MPKTKREKEKQKVRRTSAKAWAEKMERGFQSQCFKLPDGVQTFYPKKPGVYKLDIIPYRAGEGNPNADEGMEHFERTYSVHRGVGVKETSYVCPAETFNEPCPICEYRAQHRDNDELFKALKPQIRHLWRVIDRDDKAKGIQIWDTAHFKHFGGLLQEELSQGDEYDNFSSLGEDGFTIQVRLKEETFNGRKFLAVSRVDLLPRKSGLDEGLLDEPPNLDELIINTSYDQLEEIFLQTAGSKGKDKDQQRSPKKNARDEEEDDDTDTDDDDDQEEDENEEEDKPKARKGSKKLPTADDFGFKKGDYVMYEGAECQILKISPDGTSLLLEDEDGEKFPAVRPEDCEKVPVADDDEDEPKKGKGKKGAKGRVTDDDDEDEEDEDMEDDFDEDDEDMEDDEDEEEEEEASSRGRKGKKAPAKRGKR